MGPKKSTSDSSNEGGYPGLLQTLCKEEDVLIIPQFVTYLTGKQTESGSPKRATVPNESLPQLQKSKDSKTSESQKFGSAAGTESKADDLLNCGSLQPPKLWIAYANPEDKETPVAVILKNIYVEFALISAIGKSLKPYPTISCLKIENCCISREIAEALAFQLTDESGKWISDLSLDGNEHIAEMLPLFVKLPTGLKYLSLERCSLDDNDLEALAEALAYGDGKEQKLQYLGLSMNKIGNSGVFYLSEALRTNRSLVALSLAGNQIGDEGVAYLTEVLQNFPLTEREVLIRRKRIFDAIFRKKNAVQKYLEERKAKPEEENQPPKHLERVGRKIRGPDGKIRCLPGRDPKNKSASATAGEKFRGKTRSATEEHAVEPTPSEIREILQQVESEIPPDKHPFVNEVQLMNEWLWCPGCWSLGSINLAFNYLTEKSVEKFTEALGFQNEHYGVKVGLLRLVLLPGNLFQEKSQGYQKLQTAIIYRNNKRDVPENSDQPAGPPTARRISSGRMNKK